jgi:hypothetical protein
VVYDHSHQLLTVNGHFQRLRLPIINHRVRAKWVRLVRIFGRFVGLVVFLSPSVH